MLAGKDLSLLDALTVSLVGIAVVMAELAILAVLVWLLSRAVRGFETKLSKKAPAAAQPAAQAQGIPLPDNTSAGRLELENVDEPTAAMVMAVVSHQTKIPLNRLEFKSIKLLDDSAENGK